MQVQKLRAHRQNGNILVSSVFLNPIWFSLYLSLSLSLYFVMLAYMQETEKWKRKKE
jgi:hypothetical protein